MSKVIKKCVVCNNEFECWSYAAERRKTCSRQCKSLILDRKAHKCVDCGETNPGEFYGSKKQTCKKCHNVRLIQKRTDMLDRGRNLLGNKCSICGYDKCSAALEFHHTDRSLKEFEIGGAKYGWAKMKKEIEKCILLCANCHRELHYSENRL